MFDEKKSCLVAVKEHLKKLLKTIVELFLIF